MFKVTAQDCLSMPWHWILDRIKYMDRIRQQIKNQGPKQHKVGDKIITFGG